MRLSTAVPPLILGCLLSITPQICLSEIYDCGPGAKQRFTNIRSETEGCKLLDIGPVDPVAPKSRKATPAPSAATQAAARKTLNCANSAQCDLYWKRAQIWIAQNSRYRVQSVTDTVLTTHGPSSNMSAALAFQIIKIPAAGGSAQITIDANCYLPDQCRPHPIEAIAAFKGFVRE